MYGKKKVVVCDNTRLEPLSNQLSAAAANVGNRTTMLKDCHLLEAARATGGRVVSRDETVRQLFRAASDRVGELRGIVWVNPTVAAEQPIAWLEAGAPADPERQLGHP